MARSLDPIRTCAMLLLAMTTAACGSMSVTIQTADGKPVTAKGGFGGRGCIASEIDPTTGKVNFVMSQDGTSDWAGVRAIPLLAQSALTVILGSSRADETGMEGPSIVGGCDSLFTDVADTDGDATETQGGE